MVKNTKVSLANLHLEALNNKQPKIEPNIMKFGNSSDVNMLNEKAPRESGEATNQNTKRLNDQPQITWLFQSFVLVNAEWGLLVIGLIIIHGPKI